MAFKPNEREYRSMPLMAARAGETPEEKSYIVTGYATTFDKPYTMLGRNGEYNEIIDGHALDNADMTDVILQFDHEGRVYARQSNGSLQLTLDEHGLRIDADLSRTENARNLYEDIAAGMITRMSWSFMVEDYVEDPKTNTLTITKVSKVFDVSAVSIPANIDTDISARCGNVIDGAIEHMAAERLRRRRIALKARILSLKEE